MYVIVMIDASIYSVGVLLETTNVYDSKCHEN